LQAKVALLLVLLVFAFAPVVTALATTFIVPSHSTVNLTKTTGCNIFFEVQPMGDPIDDPTPPGIAW
jgi:hypothetical protein